VGGFKAKTENEHIKKLLKKIMKEKTEPDPLHCHLTNLALKRHVIFQCMLGLAEKTSGDIMDPSSFKFFMFKHINNFVKTQQNDPKSQECGTIALLNRQM
jgi:hypothetical protein